MKPHQYNRRILLAVTGLSPQIVTETLYALALTGPQETRFLPTEIHLVTTVEGRERARLMLFEHEGGRFNKLCEEYGLNREVMLFGPDNIHVASATDGTPLHDIIDESTSTAVADLITETVRGFSADPDCAIHASIAGGRKTMGFYLGYALSLYGRAQDRLSHVLVSAPFESDHQFYYPPVVPTTLIIKDRPVHTDEARVLLAEIPFVRLRDELPPALHEGRARFSDVVAEAQRAIPPLALVLDPSKFTVTAGGEQVSLKPAEFAFYWMLAERAMNERPGAHWSEEGLAEELLGFYGKLVNPTSGDFERTEEAYQRGMTKENFDPAKTHVNQAFKKVLGVRRATPYLIGSLEPIVGTRYKRSGLSLPAAAITIHAPSLPGRQDTGFANENSRHRALRAGKRIRHD